jgi:hypothetical protein
VADVPSGLNLTPPRETKNELTAREILIKEQQQRSVHTKLDSFFKPALLRSKTSTTYGSSIDEYMYCLFIVFN